MTYRTRYFFPRVFSSMFVALTLLTTASAQKPASAAVTVKDFAGTWHWIFQGKPFVTMVLEPNANGITGSITNASVHTDADGKITEAYAGTGRAEIIRSSIDGGVLHVVIKDGDDEIEWAVTLTSPGSAEIVPSGADAPKMEPIHAQKVQ